MDPLRSCSPSTYDPFQHSPNISEPDKANYLVTIAKCIVSLDSSSLGDPAYRRSLQILKEKMPISPELGWKYALQSQKTDRELLELLNGEDHNPENVSWRLSYLLSAFSTYIFEDSPHEFDDLADGSSDWDSLTLILAGLDEFGSCNPGNPSITFVRNQLELYKNSCMSRMCTFTYPWHPFEQKKFYEKLCEYPVRNGLPDKIDPFLLFRLFLGKLSGEIRALTPHNPAVLFDGGILNDEDGHAMINRVQLEEDGSYSFTVFNTGMGSSENHDHIEIDEVMYVFPLIITGLSLEFVANEGFIGSLYLKTTRLGEHTKRDLEELIQENYDLIYDRLILKGGGIKQKRRGIPYRKSIKSSCVQSSINMYMSQYFKQDEMQNLKKIIRDQLLHTFTLIQTNVMPKIRRGASPKFEVGLIRRLNAMEQIRGQLYSKL